MCAPSPGSIRSAPTSSLGWRRLKKHKVTSAAAILSLALAIGPGDPSDVLCSISRRRRSGRAANDPPWDVRGPNLEREPPRVGGHVSPRSPARARRTPRQQHPHTERHQPIAHGARALARGTRVLLWSGRADARGGWPIGTPHGSTRGSFSGAQRHSSRSLRTRGTLGAEIGILSILHTWGQTLVWHPHVHCVVPAGGLSPDLRPDPLRAPAQDDHLRLGYLMTDDPRLTHSAFVDVITHVSRRSSASSPAGRNPYPSTQRRRARAASARTPTRPECAHPNIVESGL
jgi:hypothetical protein